MGDEERRGETREDERRQGGTRGDEGRRGVGGRGKKRSQLADETRFIVSHGIIKGKGLQFPGTNFVDKTLKPPESTY